MLIHFTNLNLFIKEHVSRLFKAHKYTDKEIIEKSGFFDSKYYISNYPEAAKSDLSAIDHYLLHGAKKNYNPNANFDASFYKMANPEYLLNYQNPLIHYEKEGKSFDALICKTFKLSKYNDIFKQLRQISPIEKPHKDNNKKLRIGFFTHNLNWEGASLICKEIAFSMKKHHNISPIIFCHFNGPLKQHYEHAGIQVIQHKAFDKKIRNKKDFSSFINDVSSLINQYNIDVIYANTIISFWAVLAAKKLTIPSIFHIHESEPINYHIHSKRIDYLPLIFHALAATHKVVFVSNKTAEKYKQYNINNNFTVIKNAFDPNEISEIITPAQKLRNKLGIMENEFMFITVGTVSNRKGQVDVINAITELDEEILSRSHFVLVGDVKLPYSHYLHAKADTLPTNQSKKIHFIDKTPDVFDYYNAADGCIFTSRIESYPKAIQEAMHFKLPIISTPVDGISEQLQDGISGLFYPPGDAKKLSELITLLVTDKSLRDKLGENAFSSLQKMISPEDMMNAYSRLFHYL